MGSKRPSEKEDESELRSSKDLSAVLNLTVTSDYVGDAIFDSVHNGKVREVEKRFNVLYTKYTGLELIQAFLPKDFINAYESLLSIALETGERKGESIDIAGTGKGTGAQVKSEAKDVRSVHRKAPSAGSSKAIIRDEAALRFRSGIDRKLRKLTREMRNYLGGDWKNKVTRKCSGCNKFGDGDWNHCPYCGKPMYDV